MKKLILILSILALLLLGAWGCPDKSEQSKKVTTGAAETVENKTGETVKPVKADSGNSGEFAMEKVKEAVEELQVTTQSSTEETKAAE